MSFLVTFSSDRFLWTHLPFCSLLLPGSKCHQIVHVMGMGDSIAQGLNERLRRYVRVILGILSPHTGSFDCGLLNSGLLAAHSCRSLPRQSHPSVSISMHQASFANRKAWSSAEIPQLRTPTMAPQKLGSLSWLHLYGRFDLMLANMYCSYLSASAYSPVTSC